LVIYTRSNPTTAYPELPGIPVCRSSHRLSGVVSLAGGPLSPFSLFAGKTGVACAGIADPDAFFAALLQEGLMLSATLSFRDHCSYDRAEQDTIRQALQQTGADYLITTEKDAVKMVSIQDLSISAYAAVLELEIIETGVLETEIEKLL
jgi:tetraacyldisaccharide 4'-kinase